MTSDDVSRARAAVGGGPDDDPSLEELLGGGRRPETEDDMTVDRLLRALRAPGTVEELRGLEAATEAFVSARAEVTAAPALAAVGGRARRPLTTAAAAVAAVVASVAFAGAAAAAYTGSLPRPAQEFAHQLLGAPAPGDDASHPAAAPDGTESQGSESHGTATQSSSQPVGPDASSGAPALFGLCTAFGDRATSAAATGSTAYQNLLAAATAAHQTVSDYCKGVTAPASSHQPGAATSHGPTSHPTPHGTPDVHATVRATPSPASSHRPTP
ncbi:MAG TPA: hypothetical protein VLS51_08490, partial [Propionibacteriaceae bacterium]|nr:hypothetical protein [Propionibacteriaceae bacterium]